MNSEQRVKRLRALLAQLEQLPATAERDRMVREVRARVVDVDTGVAPATFLAAQLDATPEPEPSSPPARGGRRPRATAPPRPVRRVHAPPADRSPTRAVEPLPLVADVLLSLDDSAPLSLDEADAEQAAAPWTRGLRG